MAILCVASQVLVAPAELPGSVCGRSSPTPALLGAARSRQDGPARTSALEPVRPGRHPRAAWARQPQRDRSCVSGTWSQGSCDGRLTCDLLSFCVVVERGACWSLRRGLCSCWWVGPWLPLRPPAHLEGRDRGASCLVLQHGVRLLGSGARLCGR